MVTELTILNFAFRPLSDEGSDEAGTLGDEDEEEDDEAEDLELDPGAEKADDEDVPAGNEE